MQKHSRAQTDIPGVVFGMAYKRLLCTSNGKLAGYLLTSVGQLTENAYGFRQRGQARVRNHR